MGYQRVDVTDLTKWDFRYWSLAFQVAQWSKDPNKKVGAVLAGQDRRDISIGYNGLPPGMDDHAFMKREDKNRFILHAERNALDNAHFDPRGGTLYVTRPVCCQCAASLISRGISIVLQPEISARSSWYEDCSAAFDFMDVADLHILFVPPIDPHEEL